MYRQCLFISLLLGGLLLLFAPKELSDKLQLVFASIFQRPLAFGRDISLLVTEENRTVGVVSGSKYRRLRNFQVNTALWLQQERKKVEMLSELRNRSAWENTSLVVADVITTTMNEVCGEFLINRGKNDGLAQGQFVLGESSIIGAVSAVDARVAKVRLITDPKSMISVGIADLDVKCAIKGAGNHLAKINLLSAKHNIETGDIVWARKKPGFLETSMIAGTVVRCRRSDENPLLWDVTVAPACKIERLKSVTVVVMDRITDD